MKRAVIKRSLGKYRPAVSSIGLGAGILIGPGDFFGSDRKEK